MVLEAKAGMEGALARRGRMRIKSVSSRWALPFHTHGGGLTSGVWPLRVGAAVQELEEDAELRSKIEVYRKPGGTRHAEMQADTDDDDVPDVPLEELLEDLSAMQITDTDMSLVD